MATARPVVSVYKADAPTEKAATLPMPQVLATPLRPDLVRYVHTNMSKNKRQAYAVGHKVGYEKHLQFRLFFLPSELCFVHFLHWVIP
jgi:large subunit ribosomal protein L4e